MSGKSVLIACFDFPPNKGIGGRRWAKLAKGLASSGFDVHVIKADPLQSQADSGWTDDIQKELTLHSLPRKYPEVLSRGPKNILEKITYKLELQKVYRKEKGTVYDIAIGWQKSFLKKASKVIEDHNIENVLVTGAPFNLLYYAALLKEATPHLNLVADYRDPWLTAQNYGMQDLSYERLEEETRKQEKVMEVADWIVCPNEFLLAEIRTSAIEKPKANFHVLRHFYDKDDLETFIKPIEKTDDKIRIVYGGAIYIGMEKHLIRLSQGLLLLKESHPEIAERLIIDIYTPHQEYRELFIGHEDIVNFNPVIGKDLFHRLNEADAAFIFLAKHNANFMTTKFFEFIPFRKPLMYVGSKGYVQGFIEDNQLGATLDSPEKVASQIASLATGTLKFNSAFDISGFSLQSRTKELQALLK